MDLDLTGKNALVCGSSKGIGRATAIELAKLGANITLVSRSADLLAELTPKLYAKPKQNHDFLVVDFQETADLKRKVTELVAMKPIHILINNTGGPPGGAITGATPEEFLSAYNNHLICNHLLAQAVIPGMQQEGYGRIVNVISTSVKAPIDGLGVSNTTRGAVANWAKTLANELAGTGITVNNVLPGTTDTGRVKELIELAARRRKISESSIKEEWIDRIPMKRFAAPHEIAAAIVFLASPAAAYITGINLPVDGGRTKSL